jgi:hypothetical protein
LTLLITFRSNAQKSVILQHSGDASVYPSITTALTASVDGDTLYISGGLFTEGMAISKSLVIYGAGHYPDSTQVTGTTQLNGDITINGTAGSGSIEGLYVGDITLNGSFSNYTIFRCNVNNITCLTGPLNNILVSENVVRGTINLNSSSSNVVDNVIIEKNVIQIKIRLFNQTSLLIRNNIFLYTPTSSYRVIEGVQGAIVKNNIFMLANGYLVSNLTDDTFENNIIVYNIAGLDPSNLVNIDPAIIFVNQSGTMFDYAQDYHLAIGSPALNFGTDGTDAGIYGTASPYKLSSVPSNPHISKAVVADETDSEGKLQLRFVITGQNN